jgi:pantoate--beta-alanine ligase
MSSRNANLSTEERAAAPILYHVLKDCAAAIARGEPIARALDDGGAEIESAGFRLDYLELRDAKTLAKAETMEDGPLRLLVAARIGQTRLIDNIAV